MYNYDAVGDGGEFGGAPYQEKAYSSPLPGGVTAACRCPKCGVTLGLVVAQVGIAPSRKVLTPGGKMWISGDCYVIGAPLQPGPGGGRPVVAKPAQGGIHCSTTCPNCGVALGVSISLRGQPGGGQRQPQKPFRINGEIVGEVPSPPTNKTMDGEYDVLGSELCCDEWEIEDIAVGAAARSTRRAGPGLSSNANYRMRERAAASAVLREGGVPHTPNSAQPCGCVFCTTMRKINEKK